MTDLTAPLSSSMTITQSIQLVVGFVAMMALPVSGWLFVTQYVDTTIDKKIEQQVSPLRSQLIQTIQSLDDTESYMIKLCLRVRESDPNFSCVRSSNLRRYDPIPTYRQLPPASRSYPYPYTDYWPAQR